MQYDLGDRKIIFEGDDWFIADSADVIGAVRIGNNASIWFNAVVRADETAIGIGENSNIQDGAVLHCEAGHPLVIGRGVTVAHKAMLHGCTIGDDCLIGISAVVLNGAQIGSRCFIGAGALVLENAVIPDDSIVLGAPAKVVGQMKEEHIEQIRHASTHYIKNFRDYKKNLRPRE
jgi:carbonic anhydrase/acetyltransferase-like protein (isoleucine patch superfamily)